MYKIDSYRDGEHVGSIEVLTQQEVTTAIIRKMLPVHRLANLNTRFEVVLDDGSAIDSQDWLYSRSEEELAIGDKLAAHH